MLTITRKDLLLTISDNVIPAMGSSDVPVKFVNDTETYVDFLIEPRVGYYVNGCPKSTVCEYDISSNTIKIPAEAFKNKGILVIAIALIDNADSNHIEVTKELALEVTPAPNGTVILPATDTWQTAVANLVEQLYNQDYKPQFDEIEENLHNLVEEAQNQQNKANNQQTQIDNAIDVMGDYEIVQDNPTQIRFKKGDGTYGDTVNLGDNLASKSMVNAGYDTYSGNSYSGSASDYGIEIGKASGNYEQVTTNGYQLFDASKIATKSQGGATVTNNGDGSFTVSGRGNLTSEYEYSKNITDVSLIKKILKPGTITMSIETITNPRLIFQVYTNDSVDPVINVDMRNTDNKTVDILQQHIDNANRIRIGFVGNNNTTIQTGTIKPMLYQDGNGTWEPFTGGEPSPNPDYKQEPKFFEPKHIISSGNNLYPLDNFANLNSNFTIDDDGWFSVNYTNNTGGIEFFNIYHKPIKELKKNSNYYFTIELEKNIFSGSPTLYINSLGVGSSNSTQFATAPVTFNFSSDNKTVLLTTKESFDSSQYLLRTYLYMPNGSSVDLKFRIILSPSENTSFETYKPIYTTPLSLILRALPNGVKDTYENGVITRRVGYVEFDGSSDEGWELNATKDSTKKRFRTKKLISLIKKAESIGTTVNLLSDRYKVNSANDTYVLKEGISVDISGSVIIYNEEYSTKTIDEWEQYLQSNPIKVWYELAEPTTEQVDLPVIPSYYPFTNAWHDSEVEASDLTWNILAGQYGSGQTTIKKDEAVLTELDLNTERTATPTTVKVQLKDTSGNTFYVETSADNVYLKGTDGSEITQKNLNDKIGQLINLVAFYSASPVSVLTDLKKYITTIS